MDTTEHIASPVGRGNIRTPITLWFARVVFLLSLVIFCIAIAEFTHFDGVIVSGVSGNLGIVHRGTRFTHRVHFYNGSGSQLEVIVFPTCGCGFDGAIHYPVKPFSEKEIPIVYQIMDQQGGRKQRPVLLVYKNGENIRRIEGRISFHLM